MLTFPQWHSGNDRDLNDTNHISAISANLWLSVTINVIEKDLRDDGRGRDFPVSEVFYTMMATNSICRNRQARKQQNLL